MSEIAEEVNSVLAKGKPSLYGWRVVLMAGDEPVPVYRVLNLMVQSNYSAEFSDNVLLRVTVGRGTFEHLIYPNKDKLKVTLERTLVGERDDADDVQFEQQDLTAILLNRNSSVLEGPIGALQDRDTGDLAALMAVDLQLVSQAAESIRLRKTGGTFRGKSAMETLRYLLTKESSDLEVDEENQIDGVDVVDADNTEPRDHIVIPHGTDLTSVPDLLQEKHGGIYNSGIGFYLHRKNWYVYPLYDHTRFENTPDKRTLTVVNVPEHMYPDLESTYRTTERQVIVLAIGDTNHLNQSDFEQRNKGHGVRFMDARRPMQEFAEVKDNTVVLNRSKNNHEFQAQEDPTGHNHIPAAVMTDNTYRERSKLAARMGATVICEWKRSDPLYLYPGMPVRFLYAADGEVRALYGTLLGVKSEYRQVEAGQASQPHYCQSGLVLFIENQDDFTDDSRIA